MSNFRISVKSGKGFIPITIFSSYDNNHSPYSTFDESINFSQNSQATLKFSIATYVTGMSEVIQKPTEDLIMYSEHDANTLNPFLNFIECGRIVHFDMDDYFKMDFVITKKTPKKVGKNIIYDVECNDYLRFVWSKRGVGLTYPFDEDDIEQISPQDIVYLAKQILSFQESEWKISPFLVADDFKEKTTGLKKQITFSISGSNQYQALLEIADKFNAELVVDYRFKTISFKDKNKKVFNGYYRTDVNVNNFSMSEDFSNSSNLIFVSGGKDEYDIAVTIPGLMPENWRNYFLTLTNNNVWNTLKNWEDKPFKTICDSNPNIFTEEEDKDYAILADAMPHMQNFIYDFRQVLEKRLITQEVYNQMNEKFKDFTIPSVKYETIYPDFVSLSYDVQSALNSAENAVDWFISTAQKEGMTSQNAQNYIKDAANYLSNSYTKKNEEGKDEVVNPRFVEKVKRLGGSNMMYAYQIYYDLIKEAKTFYTLLQSKQEILKEKQDAVNRATNEEQKENLESQIEALNADIELLGWQLGSGDEKWEYKVPNAKWEGKYPFLLRRLKESLGIDYGYAQGRFINNLSLFDEDNSIYKMGGILGQIQQHEAEIAGVLSDIRKNYGEYIQEGVFSDDVELDSFALYNKAKAHLTNNLNIEKIDLSVIRADYLEDCLVKSLEVGQYIRVVDNDLVRLKKLFNPEYKPFLKELRIAAIDMQPRKSYDIKLTLEQLNVEAELLKRLVKLAAKG